jgi:hypothetical protein
MVSQFSQPMRRTTLRCAINVCKESEMKHLSAFFLTGALGLCASSAAFANVASDLPAEKTQGDIAYLSGGVGKQEAKAFEHAQSRYPLSLEFVQHAKPHDEFLSNVDVSIKDKTGKSVLHAMADGPFFLAKMQPGRYTISAKENGKTEMRHLTLAAHKPEHLVFIW